MKKVTKEHFKIVNENIPWQSVEPVFMFTVTAGFCLFIM